LLLERLDLLLIGLAIALELACFTHFLFELLAQLVELLLQVLLRVQLLHHQTQGILNWNTK
jgi:hypothetical protein